MTPGHLVNTVDGNVLETDSAKASKACVLSQLRRKTRWKELFILLLWSTLLVMYVVVLTAFSTLAESL